MSDYEIEILNRNVLIKIVKEQQEIINKAIEYIENHKETREHYEPYGAPMGNPNYITTHIFGYYELLEILKGENNDKN